MKNLPKQKIKVGFKASYDNPLIPKLSKRDYMKLLVTLSLVLALFSTQTMAASNQGLKAAFDDLEYSLSVEWDQQDIAFHKAQTDAFVDRIADLQEAGLTNAEIMDFTLSQVKDAQVAADLNQLFNLVSANKLSESEVLEMVQSIKNESLAKGANWSGVATVTSVAIFVVAAVATYAVLKTRHETAKNSISNVR